MIWKAFSNTHCNYPSVQFDKLLTRFGGNSGPHSRCWNTDVAHHKLSKPVAAMCYHSKCEYDESTSAPKSSAFNYRGTWYTCNAGMREIKTEDGSTFKCPELENFCSVGSSCPDSCLARGTCIAGKCHYVAAFKGERCELINRWLIYFQFLHFL